MREDFVLVDVSADSMEELMGMLCSYAQKKGYVKESYLEAVLERESLYPTGLPTEVLKVALPHTTDKDHVIQSGIFIAKLKKPVLFKEMGDGVKDVPVEMVFMLSVNGTSDQLVALKGIVGMFTKPEAQIALKDAQTPAEIIAAIKTHLDV